MDEELLQQSFVFLKPRQRGAQSACEDWKLRFVVNPGRKW